LPDLENLLNNTNLNDSYIQNLFSNNLQLQCSAAFNAISNTSASATVMEAVDTVSVPTGSTALEPETVSVRLEPPAKKAHTEESVLWKCMDDVVQSTDVDNQQDRSTIETQLTQYLSEPVIGQTENPLTWWRQNKERLPDLARLAHVYLGPHQPVFHQSACLALLVKLSLIIEVLYCQTVQHD